MDADRGYFREKLLQSIRRGELMQLMKEVILRLNTTDSKMAFLPQWSFGVFMWELMTKAQQPFGDIDPFEMESYLNEGYRLHQPLNCPDQLYSGRLIPRCLPFMQYIETALPFLLFSASRLLGDSPS